MPLRVRHAKTSSVPDSADASLVQPSDWNADHPITSDGPGLVGRTAAGAGPVAEVSAADGRALLDLGTAATSALSTTNAAALGTAAPGSETTVARADHVHPMPTAAQVGAEPAGAVNARIQPGTVTGRYARWNNTAARWEEFDLLGSANTWSGAQTFSLGPRINAAAGTARRLEYYSSGSIRWQIGATADAESGSNTGTNFNLLRHSDAGAVIDAPLSVNRATGLTTVTSLAIGSNQTSAIQAGTATGQLSRWNNTTGRYEPVTLNTLTDAADDAAAATAGVAVGGLYRTGSILKTRIA